jgi:hypothetical protein
VVAVAVGDVDAREPPPLRLDPVGQRVHLVIGDERVDGDQVGSSPGPSGVAAFANGRPEASAIEAVRDFRPFLAGVLAPRLNFPGWLGGPHRAARGDGPARRPVWRRDHR